MSGSEPPKPPVGESPKVAYDYGSSERARMSGYEPRKHVIPGPKEPRKNVVEGRKEEPKRPVVQR